MKKSIFLVGAILISNTAFAGQAVLKCRTSGFVDYNSKVAFSSNCNSSEYQCKQNLERDLKNKYGSLTSACEKALGGSWYSDGVRYKY